MVIEWSERARADIRDLHAYIAKDSPYYARRFTDEIIASVEKLVEFPKIGRVVPLGRRLRQQGFHPLCRMREALMPNPATAFPRRIQCLPADINSNDHHPFSESGSKPPLAPPSILNTGSGPSEQFGIGTGGERRPALRTAACDS